MDIIECIETISGEKLLDYQKEFIRYVEEHPDCKIAIGRGSTGRNHELLMSYLVCKSILLKEEK